jgi:hypothetical protein
MAEPAKPPRSTRNPPALKQYKVAFFETAISAISAREEIAALCAKADQVNVVIRAEGNSQDAALGAIDAKIKVFAGTAWWQIHERRKADGWYDKSQE